MSLGGRLFVSALAVGFPVVPLMAKGLQERRWLPVEGRVVAVGAEYVRYEYGASRDVYVKTQRTHWLARLQGWDPARYAVGDRVTIRCSPRDAELSVLDPCWLGTWYVGGDLNEHPRRAEAVRPRRSG